MNRKSHHLVFVELFVAVSGFMANGVAFGGDLFLPYITYSTGSCAEAVAIGDINNDGLNDVVVATNYNDDPANGHHIHVFLQQPTGELAFSAKYEVFPASYVYHPKSVDIGDLDNDGKSDVVVSARQALLASASSFCKII